MKSIFKAVAIVTIFSVITWAVGILIIVLAIIGIINAVQGKAKELPIIGKIKILK